MRNDINFIGSGYRIRLGLLSGDMKDGPIHRSRPVTNEGVEEKWRCNRD